MTKRAARYIRTAPNQVYYERILSYQDAQTTAYCRAHEYEVVDTYIDIDKFAHENRPDFQRMLDDARQGKFDVIVAIHEDRLYRGICPAMIAVADLVRDGKVLVELVVEGYE